MIVELPSRLAGGDRPGEMGSIHPTKTITASTLASIQTNLISLPIGSSSLASQRKLIEAVRAAGGLARNVEAYLKQKRAGAGGHA